MENKRLINWWLDWNDLNWPNHDGLDRIKRRAEKAAQASVTTAILFGAHFRWDYLPYFTILHDHIAATAEQLHQYGIELYDRHSVNLIHRYDTREQMRHVMLHSGPHLPFSPSREAAASWEYQGKRLNDWRMIDVKDRKPLYYPQYAAEGFCYRNPEYLEAYCDYAKKLVADTGIDGLAAEDAVHYMHWNSCACPHCRAELKRRAGIDLPPIEDKSFWGNWENPAFHHWIELRYDAGRAFFEKLMPCLPKDFPVTTCGANSASHASVSKGYDARNYAKGGSNYVHTEMSGNTPPYKHDPVTVNVEISDRVVNFSHHQAVAKEHGTRSFSTGYGFTEPSANIIWAVNKVLDADCCFSTLKARLGLPGHILQTLPDEADVIGKAFGFEKAHPELFVAQQIGQIGVFYSELTRDHTCFGAMKNGYSKDFSKTLLALFKAGISAHTVFSFPEDAKQYPAVVVPSVAKLTEDQLLAMRRYVAAGGKLLVTGPSAIPECKNDWVLPTRVDVSDPVDFFDTIANGVWHKSPEWVSQMKVPPISAPCRWEAVSEGILYNPHRVSDGQTELVELCRRYIKPMPVKITQAQGYIITTFENEQGITVHLLAEDYDTDIDHHLDEIRFHRSRMNLVTKVEPIGISREVRLEADTQPKVYTPFNEESSDIRWEKGVCTVTLPEKTAYALLHFPK